MGADHEELGYQKQFNAAVSVIQNLPKNGSYRPSYEEMLRFYSYYKQATVGACNIPRPGFWDPIGRYKWDAWNRLGGMSREEAMSSYIKEMKIVAQKVIDTVPLQNTNPEMFEYFRPLYEVIPDMPRPPESFIRIAPEQMPLRHRERRQLKEEGEEVMDAATQNSLSRGTDVFQLEESQISREETRRDDPVGEDSNQYQDESKRGQVLGAEKEDLSENLDPHKECEHKVSWIYPHLFQASSDLTESQYMDQKQRGNSLKVSSYEKDKGPKSTTAVWQKKSCKSHYLVRSYGSQNTHPLNPQIKATIQFLQTSIQGLCQRLEGLERTLQNQRPDETFHQHRRSKPWFPLSARSRTLLLILVWPFIVHWLLHKYSRRK
ncbi:hypothetical protein GDO86_014416 [Hymenochirus boettgeri]|uniref:Acyl-CoA-binding domain-containing protein 5 n=1 Tax=Hymenochirus boettgeri TaxID=247094 RepID=A0A8T2JTZ5_9PIPI|nr:hypothetical protein GDO86_014416 [Hymenochirus boettgeri]